MTTALVLLPFLGAVSAFLLRSTRGRRAIFVGVAVLHFVMTLSMWVRRPGPMMHGWLFLDALGLLFLTITSFLFLAASLYGINYLRHEPGQMQGDVSEEGGTGVP